MVRNRGSSGSCPIHRANLALAQLFEQLQYLPPAFLDIKISTGFKLTYVILIREVI
jgi:hypothetical protein